jgi:hypothetical protein
MAKLGDYLPHKEKGQYIETHLKPGQILYLFCDFTTPPKEKYLEGVSKVLFYSE